MLPLTTHDLGPAAQCLIGIPAAEVVVSHQAAYQTVVGAVDDVLIIDGELRQRAYIDLEFQLFVYVGGQLGVKCVDTFHDEDAPWAQFKGLAAVERVAFLEVKGRYFDLFAAEQGVEVLVEQRDVECVHALKVVLSVGQFRCTVAPKEVVVQRHLVDVVAKYAQLHTQPAA